MIDPEVAAEIANCPPGSRYELFLKHMDVFELPPEKLEVNDVEDRQIGDAAELQNFDLYTPEAQLDFAHGGNIGIPAPNAGLVVPKVEPYDFAAYAPRERVLVQIDHPRSLGYERNQAPSPNSVFISNGSSSGERDILRSSNNAIEVSTDMRQSQSSPKSSSGRKSKRLATKERRPLYDDFEWSLPQSKAVRCKKLLQKKKKRMSLLSHLTEVSPGCSHRRAEENKCTHCGITETTEWNDGPSGPNTLCRLCRIQYRCSRIQDQNLEATPTSDPEFSQEAVNVTNNVVQGADMAPDMAHVAVPEIGPEMSQSSVHFEDQPWENLRPRNQKKKYREMAAEGQPGKCTHCGIEKTVQWREGPMGRRTLCNACGLRFKLGRLYPEYRPANSPTFVPSVNSNSHRQVVAMRKRRVANELSSSENESTQPQSDAVKEASTEFPASLPNANEEIAVMEEASSSEKESTHPQSEAATKLPTGSILPLKDMEETAVVEANPSLSLSETTKEIRAQMPQSDGSVCEFFELACYVNLLQENVKTMKDKLSNLLDESGLNKNQLHEAIVKEEVNEEPSMPLGPPFEATTECVVGLVAKRVISPPMDVKKINMAGIEEAPVSERGGPVIKRSRGGDRFKRVPKKRKEENSRKKLRKLSGEGGAQKTMSQGTSLPKRCIHCDSSQTPQWRDGPLGRKTLCNACGLRYRAGGLLPEYRPFLSPGFVPTLHSSLQKQVIQMRKKGTHEEAMGASSVNQEAANVEMGPQTPPPPECTPTNSYSVNSESGDLCCFP